MMLNATMDKMRELKLFGMLSGLETQLTMASSGQLAFEERLGLLVDQEATQRQEKRTKSRLKAARLKDSGACIEDIDFSAPRGGLDKNVIMSLAGCDWIKRHQNLVFIGPTGIGKGYLSSALIQRACMGGYTAQFIRIPRLFPDLALAKVDGRYYKMMASFARTDVLVFDDWGQTLTENDRRDFLEIIEDRYGTKSTIITSQVPIEEWPKVIGDPTMADAIMDRLLHNAHKIVLKGPSMRKLKAKGDKDVAALRESRG